MTRVASVDKRDVKVKERVKGERERNGGVKKRTITSQYSLSPQRTEAVLPMARRPEQPRIIDKRQTIVIYSLQREIHHVTSSGCHHLFDRFG